MDVDVPEGLNAFEVQYFTQTRQEIDTEKRERDHILNFVVAVYGAIAFALVQNPAALGALVGSGGLWTLSSVGVLILALFYARNMKLQQIADRWFVLDGLLSGRLPPADVDTLMEPRVVAGLRSGRYEKKDLVLCLAFSLPLYGLLARHGVAGVLVAVAHAGASYGVLAWRFRRWIQRRHA